VTTVILGHYFFYLRVQEALASLAVLASDSRLLLSIVLLEQARRVFHVFQRQILIHTGLEGRTEAICALVMIPIDIIAIDSEQSRRCAFSRLILNGWAGAVGRLMPLALHLL